MSDSKVIDLNQLNIDVNDENHHNNSQSNNQQSFVNRSGIMSNAVIVICFSILIIVSLAGNSLVCRTLFRQRRFCANSTNVLIGMLAISDLMMTTFNIPFTVVDIILNDWIFGNFFCILVSFVQANSVYVSSFTMAIIAIDRYIAIYKFKPKSNDSNSTNSIKNSDANHLNSKRLCCFVQCFPICPLMNKNSKSKVNVDSKSRTKFKMELKTRMITIIIAIWITAALHSLPHTIFNRVTVIGLEKHDHPQSKTNDALNKINQLPKTLRRCVPMTPSWFGPNFGLWLTLYTTATQYIIPLSCAAIIYTRIAFTINSQGKVGHMTETRAERINKHKRRRLLMLALIVAIFAVCWLPFNIYYLLLDFGITKSYNHMAFLICLWLATSSVCYNPFVYCWLNKSFRREAKTVWNRIEQILLCCCCCRISK